MATFFSIRNIIDFYQLTKRQEKSSVKSHLVRRKRRSFSAPLNCVFHKVNQVEEKIGGKKTIKLVLDNEAFGGGILDLSSGGCALKTAMPIKAGSKLKLELVMGRVKANVLGQVLRVNKSGGFLTLHIKFIKIPPVAANNISAFVFNYV